MTDIYHKDLAGAELHDSKLHKATHETAGADEINLSALIGEPATLTTHRTTGSHDGAQKVTIRKNTGADVGTRTRINLIEGTNVSLVIADDPVDNEVDITIGETLTPLIAPNFQCFSEALFGGGGDGSLVVSANTTLSAGTGGIKVMHYNNLTIDAGFYLEGHADDKVLVLLVMGTLTLNGTIRMNGRGGVGGSGNIGDGGDAGAFGGGGGGDTTELVAAYAAGGGGGGGQIGKAGTSGSPGITGYGGGKYQVDGTATFTQPLQVGVGAGGDGVADATGQAGVTYMSALRCPLPFELARYLYGGGGGEGAYSSGGDGGRGGGVLWVEAKIIIWGGAGVLSSNAIPGSIGGNASSGGGGGGGGGFVQLVYKTKTGTSTLQATSGVGGATGGIAGKAGGIGAAGLTVEVQVI